MNEKLITVFTPTYNRGYCLKKLYNSLVSQSSKNFKWNIIDDGSTDDTATIVEKMINEKKIDITYDYQKNCGKHVAHNRCVENCNTELFFCVDSDDQLPDDAINKIEIEWREVCKDKKKYISGIVGYKSYPNSNIIGNEFAKDISYSGLKQLYSKGKQGDTALIYITDILSKYPFPAFEGERFIRENLAYDLIDDNYKLKVCREILYIGEYLEDGLSKNATRLEHESPKGAAYFRFKEYEKSKSIKSKVRNLAGYIYFSIKAKDIQGSINQIGLLKFIVIYPIAVIGSIRYKRILRKK